MTTNIHAKNHKISKRSNGEGLPGSKVEKRAFWQLWQHEIKARDALYKMRVQAQKSKHFDHVQYLTDAIRANSEARANIRAMVKNKWDCEPDALEAYK